MTDDNGRDLSAYPKPGTAEVGFIEFGPASARRAALKTTPAQDPPLQKAPAEYVPTPLDRIAAALERIAMTLERTDI